MNGREDESPGEVSGTLTGTWQGDGKGVQERLAQRLDILSEQIEIESKLEAIRQDMEKTREQIEVHSRTPSLRPHPKQTKHFVMPLITAGNGGQKYRPFGLGDVQAIVDKMPPISEGGGRWLGKLDSLTAGQMMALGDF